MDLVKVVVGMCTCRNDDGLYKLLSELSTHESIHDIRYVVVENDPGQSGRKVCALFSDKGMPVDYVVEEKSGIPFARNALVAAAMTSQPAYVLMIDDDEYPLPGWVDNMVAAAVTNGADIVGGAVAPSFDSEVTEPARASDFTKNRAASFRGKCIIQSTANLLISGKLLNEWDGVLFDADYAHTGGSDSIFLKRAWDKGYRHYFAENAVVMEDIPRNRLTEDWLVRRQHRTASTYARVLLSTEAGSLQARLLYARAAALQCRSYIRDALNFKSDKRKTYLSKRDRARSSGIINAIKAKYFQEYSSDNYR